MLRATLDTTTHMLRGTGAIHYENHSPDTLTFVWLHLEQNMFAPGSVTHVLNQPPLLFEGGAMRQGFASAFALGAQGLGFGFQSLGGRGIERKRHDGSSHLQ